MADSGLLSKKNLEALVKQGYGYILGARIKKESDTIREQILAMGLSEAKPFGELKKDDCRLIVSFSAKRAQKDYSNRKKGLRRLEKKLQGGQLSKESINARGYNKYLRLEDRVRVSIDYEKFEEDHAWDGLKGYVTNTDLPTSEVIENYANLWQIEKAFRISKTDLQIRPIYHSTRRRIEAHICICFAAYTVYKELERILYKYQAPFSAQAAREIVQTIYQLHITLPDSGVQEKILLGLDEEQRLLLDVIGKENL